MKKLSQFLGSLWLFLTALNLSAATSGDKIGTLSGTTPTINWNTEQIKTWTLSGNSTPTQSNVPGTTTQRFQLELLVTQPAGQNHTISTPSGWVWLSTDWSALPSDSTNRIVLEKLGSKVYATWVDEPIAPEFSLTPTFIPQASSATTLGDSTMSQVSVDTILQAGKFALGTSTNILLVSGADLVYTNAAYGGLVGVKVANTNGSAYVSATSAGNAQLQAPSGKVTVLSVSGSSDLWWTGSIFLPVGVADLGAATSPWRDIYLASGSQITWNGSTNSLIDTWGSDSPEGVITALSGSLYRDAANGNIYKKGSGAGNTGWVNLGSGGGDVTGPASSTDNDISVFDGSTGKIIKRSTSAATLGDASSPTFTNTWNLSGANDPSLIAGNGFLQNSGQWYGPDGSAAAPTYSFSSSTNSGMFFGSSLLQFPITGTTRVSFSTTTIFIASSAGTLAVNSDTFLVRDSAAVWQLGIDAASPVAQTLKGNDGSGTDRPGGAITFAGGKGTGTGLGGAWIAQTSITNATGSTAQTLGNGIYIYASDASLTESSATGVFTVALPASKYIGIDVHAVTHADDNTDFTATTDTFNVTAIAKSTAISSNVSALQTSTIGSAGSTLTTAWTVTDNGDNTFTLKNNAVASLTQVRLKTKWQVRICSDAPATITPL